MRVKYLPSSLTGHTIYIKEHSVREHSDNRPPGRTLFVLNVPPFIDEKGLKNVFGKAGDIESVQLQEKPSAEKVTNSNLQNASFKVAYIVFSKKSELKNALSIKQLAPVCDDNTSACSGAIQWIKEYNSAIPNINKLKEDIEQFMTKYDEKTKDKIETEKSLGEADDDGWITVTRHSRKPGFERKETVGNKIMAQEKNRQQKKELTNFYSFQIRESKMKHIITLRQKFEEDKKKIALLKESRRFRPF